MFTRVPSILSISYEEPLLRTRHWILETAGFKVTSALGLAQAAEYCQTRCFDLVIIGHSIPIKDKKTLLALVQDQNRTRVLSLLRPGETPVPGVYHSIETSEGPAALVAAVQKALVTKGSSDLN